MEELISGKIRMQWSSTHFRPSTDSMVLADFAECHTNEKVCDLGCGCGTLMLLLAGKQDTAEIWGIEYLPEPAQFAQKNVEANGFSSRMHVISGDLRDASLLKAGSFDCVVSNPPYYPLASGIVSQRDPLADARSEKNCTLFELCACASRIVRFGGRFYLVHKPERLCDVLCALRENKLEPKRLQFVRHNEKTSRSLVLIEARRGANGGLKVSDDLILFRQDGTPSDDWRRIYHQEA